jgi:hypothetical protein
MIISKGAIKVKGVVNRGGYDQCCSVKEPLIWLWNSFSYYDTLVCPILRFFGFVKPPVLILKKTKWEFGLVKNYVQFHLHCTQLRTTLDEGPRSNEIEQSYRLRAINWTHSLVMRVQDQEVTKSRLNLHCTKCFGQKINWVKLKKIKINFKAELMIWRSQDAS